MSDPKGIVQWSLDQGAAMVALKLGEAGCLVAARGGVVRHVAPHPVHALDATGAGDCFAGALLARLCAGDDFTAAARAANIAAAMSTPGYGAVTPLPRWADVQTELT